jgi:acyl-CoA synthetase (AMP-forming)/AMP-acid ligase II
LPVTAISGREVLAAHAERKHDPTAGTCVGRPLQEITLRIIPVTDEPIASWSDELPLPTYQVGEICVKGAPVTRTYVERPRSTAQAKIADRDEFWHRMGDLGYLDDAGRIWFYGRKSHRVETSTGPLYTEPVELIFNQHPSVFRSALVGVGDRPQRPVVVLELLPGQAGTFAPAQLIDELRSLAQTYPMTAGITDFLIHPAFPVDIRHNAKIFREKLALWAAEEQNKPAR